MVEVRSVPRVRTTGAIRVTSETAAFYHFQNRRVFNVEELANETFIPYRLNSHDLIEDTSRSQSDEILPNAQPAASLSGETTSGGTVTSTFSARTFDQFIIAGLVSREIKTDGTLRGITYDGVLGLDGIETPTTGVRSTITHLSNIGVYAGFVESTGAQESALLDIQKIRTVGLRNLAIDGVPCIGVETIEGSVPITDTYTITDRVTAAVTRFNLIGGTAENPRNIIYPAGAFVTEVTEDVINPDDDPDNPTPTSTERNLFVSRISNNSSRTRPSQNPLAWNSVNDYDSTRTYAQACIVGRANYLFMNNEDGASGLDPLYNPAGANWHISNTLSTDSGVIEYVEPGQANPNNLITVRNGQPDQFSPTSDYVMGEEVLSANNRIYNALNARTGNVNNVQPHNDPTNWAESTYQHGDLVIHDNRLQVINTTTPSEDGIIDATRVDTYTASTAVQPFTGTEYNSLSIFRVGSVVTYQNRLYDLITEDASGTRIALDQIAANRDPTFHLGNEWVIINVYDPTRSNYPQFTAVRVGTGTEARYWLALVNNPAVQSVGTTPDTLGTSWLEFTSRVGVEPHDRRRHYPISSIVTVTTSTVGTDGTTTSTTAEYYNAQRIEGNGDNDVPGQPLYREIARVYAPNTAYANGTDLLFIENPGTSTPALFRAISEIPADNTAAPGSTGASALFASTTTDSWSADRTIALDEPLSFGTGTNTRFFRANARVTGTQPQPTPNNNLWFEVPMFQLRTAYTAGEFVTHNILLFRVRADITAAMNTTLPDPNGDAAFQRIITPEHSAAINYVTPPSTLATDALVTFTAATDNYATQVTLSVTGETPITILHYIPLQAIMADDTDNLSSPAAINAHYRLAPPEALVWNSGILYPFGTIVGRPNGLFYTIRTTPVTTIDPTTMMSTSTEQPVVIDSTNHAIRPETPIASNPWRQLSTDELIGESDVRWDGRRAYTAGEITTLDTFADASNTTIMNQVFRASNNIAAPADTADSNQNPLTDTMNWTPIGTLGFAGYTPYDLLDRVIHRGRVYEVAHPTSGVAGNEPPAVDARNWRARTQRPFGEIRFDETYVTGELQLFEGALIRAKRSVVDIPGRAITITDSPYLRSDEYQVLGGRIHYDARRFVRIRRPINEANAAASQAFYLRSDYAFYEFRNFETRGLFSASTDGLVTVTSDTPSLNELIPTGTGVRGVNDHSFATDYTRGQYVTFMQELYIALEDNVGHDPRANVGIWERVYGVEEFEVGQVYNAETVAWIGDTAVLVVNNNLQNGEINHRGFSFATDPNFHNFTRIEEWTTGSEMVSSGTHFVNRGGVYRALNSVSRATEPATSPSNYRLVSIRHDGYLGRNGDRYVNSYARNRSETLDQLVAIRVRPGNSGTTEYYNHLNGIVDTMEITVSSADNRVDIGVGFIFQTFAYESSGAAPIDVAPRSTSPLTPSSITQGDRGTLRFREPVSVASDATQFTPVAFGYEDLSLSTTNNSEIEPQAFRSSGFAVARRTFEATGTITSYWAGDNPFIRKIYDNTRIEINYFLRTPMGSTYTFYYPGAEITEGTPGVASNNDTMTAAYGYRCTGVNVLNIALEVGFFDAILNCPAPS